MDGPSPLAVTRLIPRENRTYYALAAGGAAMIGVLVLLYASWAQWGLLARWGLVPTDGRVEALDLDGEGSLAVWFSSGLLFLAGQVSLLIGWLRAQSPDDYAGRYRLWFWAAACWFALSLDETASLHEAFKELASRLAGTRLIGDGSIWWAAPYFIVLAALGFQLLWEMRGAWVSSTLLQATGWFWALAVAAQMELILPSTGARGVMVEESCEMLGDLLLLLSLLLYARFLLEPASRGKSANKMRLGRSAADSNSGGTPAANVFDEAEAARSRPESIPTPHAKRTSEAHKH